MLKNGTLLKVSPELIQALKNALDLRYLPLIQQARRQRRSLITDDVEAVDTGYNGYFKVIWDNEVDEAGNVTKRRVKVINGALPDDQGSGVTDVGSVYSMSADVPDGSNSLYLVAQYNNGYAFSLAWSIPEQGMWQELALVTDIAIQQVWTGGTIYFGERYWV